MTSLVLDMPDFSLSVQDSVLHIAHPQQPSRLLPLAEIERVVVGKGIAISTDLHLKLSELGKELVIVGHKHSAMIFNSASAPNNLRLLQYQAICQESQRLVADSKTHRARFLANRIRLSFNPSRATALLSGLVWLAKTKKNGIEADDKIMSPLFGAGNEP
ncbi:CRISPR-associated endonuclease Cas1 [Vibrio metschnikovii]|uniref:CRISPR-associated endonuclease Cas1 n=1 Tax=Vibrio metschnikovii TaxID=28172 RepID=UPI001C3007B0|nr:CRISPR-associated endonuclease Cas1 [Vibrio metschnikovii]